MNKQLKSVVSNTAWGVVLCVGALWFWHYLVGNPFDELELIRRGLQVQGFIVDTWEEAESGDEAALNGTGALYKYRVPDGQEFTQQTKESSAA
ncbi:MAG: hypothetical protein IPP33_13435 [Flavobacteriales bacterium]|nr:hypothetical protein [Flavobacteriales bacterium]